MGVYWGVTDSTGRYEFTNIKPGRYQVRCYDNDRLHDIIAYKDVPVVTTRMLADFYETNTIKILNNFNRNKEWFVEGKHFYRLTGEERKSWYLLTSLRGQKHMDMRGRSLILWTQRGVGQHVRMINTKEAWTISCQ